MGVSEQEGGNKRRVAIIDADFIPFYVCYNKKENGIDIIPKTFEECKAMCDDFIKNILIATKATYFIMCFTVGKCFRYQVNPEYKANRKYLDTIPFLKEIKEYLIEKYKGVYNKEYEADDLVATFKNYFDSEGFIVSPDKDLLKLFGQHFNPRTMSWQVTIDADKAFWKSMIIGDTTDNIKGIPKKGEKAAEKILGQFTENLREIVLEEYCKHFGEYEGIKEFYKNYFCLKIVDNALLGAIDLISLNEVKAKEEETLDEI